LRLGILNLNVQKKNKEKKISDHEQDGLDLQDWRQTYSSEDISSPIKRL
jgi:hypothetical protein